MKAALLWWQRSLLGLLALGGSRAAHAQATSASPSLNHWSVKPGTLVYLDGLPSTPAKLDQVPNAAVACVEGMVGQPGVRWALGDPVATEYLVLTTKANENSPATLALADRANLPSAYRWELGSVRDIAPRALAYITAHYPKYWLDGTVTKLTRKSSGEVTYQVRIAGSWGWRHPCFPAAGDFVAE
ncbi:MAG: hypothetical protein ACRYFK_09735 [Janthinobacterium lividum]